MKIKLSNYVAQKVSELGVRHVFMVTGGGSMHLNQSLGQYQALECIFNHHEQAAAMAAESYYRLTNRIALVNVTTGPGGTNAITGIYGAWTDSIGMVVISGQVKYETTVHSTGLPLRQLGDQEVDIVRLVAPITKYSIMVTDPETIRYHLEKAFYLAVTGRPGPCWIDIPLNIQGANIEVDNLLGFDATEYDAPWENSDLVRASDQVLEKLQQAKRPVVFAGSGVRLSSKHDDFIRLVDRLGLPVVTGWNAHDVIWSDHPCYIGRPGSVGDRAGNFTVQNSDLLLILGSRLNIRQISYNWKSFATQAYKIWIDIDEQELKKSTVEPHMPIHADLKSLLPILIERKYMGATPAHREWLNWCKDRQKSYPVVLPEYWVNEKINPYCFMDTLFGELDNEAIVVTSNGSACVISFQVAELKNKQRLWTNSGCCSMGYELPAAIGACKGSDGRSIVCLAGDGSIMMNLQELQTIVGNELPIKIFILNNNGYSSISQTHKNFFGGIEVGASPESGLNFPDFVLLKITLSNTFFFFFLSPDLST